MFSYQAEGILMSGEVSFVEIEGQQVELLPARTLLSLLQTGDIAVANVNASDNDAVDADVGRAVVAAAAATASG